MKLFGEATSELLVLAKARVIYLRDAPLIHRTLGGSLSDAAEGILFRVGIGHR